jgi:putative transposase
MGCLHRRLRRWSGGRKEIIVISEEQLLRLFIRQNIPLMGRKIVETVRTSDPTRRVGGGTHNVVTRFASRKMGCVIQAESHKCELPAIYEWENDPGTHEFYDQPTQVKLSYKTANGRRATHMATPDFFLIQDEWMGWIECKPLAALQASYETGSDRYVLDATGSWCCPPGENFAADYGLGFRVRLAEDTNWILVRNLEFLSDYLRPDCPIPDRAAQGRLQSAFASERWVLLKQLLEHPGISADAVFAAIARGILCVDIERELLAEPIFTKVCRDGLSFELYTAQKDANGAASLVTLPKIVLRTGVSIMWDGQPWRILNVGDSDIFMEDHQRTISNLRLDLFQSLVAQGAISSLPEVGRQAESPAEQIMRRAAPTDVEQAIRRCRLLDPSNGADERIPPRTLRYWRRRAADGAAAYGNRFAGLVPRISARGNRERKVASQVIEVMNDVIDTEVLTANQTKTGICYGMVINRCRDAGLVPPSRKTFSAEIRRRHDEVVVLARQGRKAAYPLSGFHWHLDQSTPRHGDRPFEIGHIDHTELDIELVDSRSGANLGRPWLTIFIDAFTRMILAFFLTFDPPSYRSCMAVIQNAVRRHGRIPRTIVVDQGSDFESMYFEALLARLESHKKSRPASKGRFGSVIERFFGVNNQMFIHNLAGNNQALQSPRSMSPSHDPRTLAVWTLPALTTAFEEFADKLYANLQHAALGVSPKAAMASGLAAGGHRAHTLIPYTEEFRRLCMPTTRSGTALVRAGRGAKIREIFYWHPIFREPTVANRKVPVVFDPFDISRAFAFANGEWVLCRSEYQSLFERRTEREITILSQEIRARHQRDEIRRSVNASVIAEFITEKRGSEAVMRQQRRDAEQRAHDVSPTESNADALPSGADSTNAPTNPWSGFVPHETFGELK